MLVVSLTTKTTNNELGSLEETGKSSGGKNDGVFKDVLLFVVSYTQNLGLPVALLDFFLLILRMCFLPASDKICFLCCFVFWFFF